MSSNQNRAGRKLLGALLLLIAGIVLVFGVAGPITALAPPQRDLQPATIAAGGYQVISIHKAGSSLPPAKIAVVKIRLQDGTVRTVESDPLLAIWEATAGPVPVTVQLDNTGFPKRVRYHGKWYGTAPPLWFWIGFAVVLVGVGLGLGYIGLRLVRRPRGRIGGRAQSVPAA